jgi:hypothetical protein
VRKHPGIAVSDYRRRTVATSKVLVDTGDGIFTYAVEEPAIGDVVLVDLAWKGPRIGVVINLSTDYNGACKSGHKPTLPQGLSFEYTPPAD